MMWKKHLKEIWCSFLIIWVNLIFTFVLSLFSFLKRQHANGASVFSQESTDNRDNNENPAPKETKKDDDEVRLMLLRAFLCMEKIIWFLHLVSFDHVKMEKHEFTLLVPTWTAKQARTKVNKYGLLTKQRSRRLDIGLVLFLRVYGPRRRRGP